MLGREAEVLDQDEWETWEAKWWGFPCPNSEVLVGLVLKKVKKMPRERMLKERKDNQSWHLRPKNFASITPTPLPLVLRVGYCEKGRREISAQIKARSF